MGFSLMSYYHAYCQLYKFQAIRFSKTQWQLLFYGSQFSHQTVTQNICLDLFPETLFKQPVQ